MKPHVALIFGDVSFSVRFIRAGNPARSEAPDNRPKVFSRAAWSQTQPFWVLC
jgi:hypothetical protein